MSRNHGRLLTAATASLLLLSCLPNLSAQQAPEGRKWIISNPKFVELTSAGIHILPTDAKQGLNSVETAVHLPASQPWKVAFDVQMGPTLLNSMSIHLLQGKTDVAWLGADSYYKSMSAFVGGGNANMPFSQPWDTNWHSFAYTSDGKTLSLWHNGVKCGKGASSGTPDTLEIGSTQLELRVRNVHIEGLVVLPLAITKTPKPLVAADIPKVSLAVNPAVTDDSKASLPETEQWICDTINKLAGTFYRDGIAGQSYSKAYFDGNKLTYSSQDDYSEFHSSLVIYESHAIPFDKADENSVALSAVNAVSDADAASYKVTISSLDNAPLFSKNSRTHSDAEPDSPATHEDEPTFTIWFGDKKMAERFAKAVRHGIRLCKANPIKEPF